MPRPALTLIQLTTQHVVRADFDARGHCVDFQPQARPDLEDLGLLVEFALPADAPCGKKIYVLWHDLFSHTVRLDAKSFGLKGEQLVGALGFEVEPMSGIGVFDSRIGYVAMGTEAGQREFWVTQARTFDLENCRDAVQRVGGRLVGLLPNVEAPGHYVEGGDDARARLQGWADHLQKPRVEAPILAPPPRPMSSEQRALVALLFGVIVAGLCAAHHYLWAEPMQLRLLTEQKQFQQADAKLVDLEKQIKAANDSKEAKIKSNDKLAKTVKALSIQRSRLVQLMTYLGSHARDDILIKKIETPNGELLIHGWSLTSKGPSQLAQALHEQAEPLGWHLLTPKSTALHLAADGGPWAFELQFRDTLAPIIPVTQPGRPAPVVTPAKKYLEP